MNSKDIKFAQELLFNLKIDSNNNDFVQNQVIDFQIVGNGLLLSCGDEFVSADIVGPSSDIIEELINKKDRSLLRLDKVDQANGLLVVTLLSFYQHIKFDESFVIVIDQAIQSELRKINIKAENACDWLKKEVLFDDKYAFSVGNDSSKSELLLIGKKYSVLIAESAQGYMHVIELIDSKRQRAENLISLISGNILIEDKISNYAAISQEFRDKYDSLVRDNAELINLWKIYDELDLECIREEAKGMGFLSYKSYRRQGDNLVFALKKGFVNSEFLSEGMYYAAIPERAFNEEDPLSYNPLSAVIVGSVFDKACMHSHEFVIEEDVGDAFKKIPDCGYLAPSIAGSVIQSKRRQIARSSILNGKNKMLGLNVLLQSGEVVGTIGKSHPGITDRLEKYIFNGDKNKHFNDRQKEAIKIAINTPDVAVIQGPPGTGKTQVIRAIIERINEIENGEARILVSSTQHDAVDNAIKNVSYGGVPANRAVNKIRGRSNDMPIFKWIDKMVDSCGSWLENNQVVSNDMMESLYRAIECVTSSKEEDMSNNLDVLYNELQSRNFSANVLSSTREVSTHFAESTFGNRKERSSLLALLDSQAMTISAYLEENGKESQKALERYLKFDDDEVDFEIPDYWKTLKHSEKVTDETTNLFSKFKLDIDKLKIISTSASSEEQSFDSNKEIALLIRDIENEIVDMECDSQDSKLFEIIHTFKRELSSTENVKRLIESYSQVNAATCQQSANENINPAMHGFNDEYDYVIIDEAARSNPLDLLIPMSMGHKIILVGDHKQLPHMVERDIIDEVIKKTGDESVKEVLEESLFMRLFNKINEEDLKRGTSRTCVLNEQFRMHGDICDLINVFYKEENLKTACGNDEKAHNLDLYQNKALAWIDVPSNGKYHFETPGISKKRNDEIDVIIEELNKILFKNEATDYEIGIISFYSSQVNALRTRIDEEFPADSHRIVIGTVDAFQGKEFDVVLLSTVRSNDESDMRRRVGFLNNNNRLCVAFSRAKRLLITVGDSHTVAYDGENEIIAPLNELFQRCKKGEIGYYECKTI